MTDWWNNPIINIVIGTMAGVMGDRIWQRYVNRPRFRVSIGQFKSLRGDGVTLNVENVGSEAVLEYDIALFHPERGTMHCFDTDPKTVFPQHPKQENTFRCYTDRSHNPRPDDMLEKWFVRKRNEPMSAKQTPPEFSGYELQLILRNSEEILFKDRGMGNHLACSIYGAMTKAVVEHPPKEAFYRSQAPWWVEFKRSIQSRLFLRRLKKEQRQIQERTVSHIRNVAQP